MTSIDEQPDLHEATDVVTLTVELPRALVERLKTLADRTEWDESDFVREALSAYIPTEEQELSLTGSAINEVSAGTGGIPHDRVMEWMESWETPGELPPPT